MAAIKVGIVEDEIIVGHVIIKALLQLGYATAGPAVSYIEALEMIEAEKPDILVLDINLNGKKDGIDLAWKIQADHNVPFIFLTSNADAATVARAKETRPSAYLLKPFTKEALYAAIEICLHNFAHTQQIKMPAGQDNYIIQDAIFIKQGHQFRKIKRSEILYLESENVYVYIHTKEGKLLVRSTLSHYLDLLVPGPFFRVHRSYAVNAEHIQAISVDHVIIGGNQLPVSKIYREELLERLCLG